MENGPAGDINQDAITTEIVMAKAGFDFKQIKYTLYKTFDDNSEKNLSLITKKWSRVEKTYKKTQFVYVLDVTTSPAEEPRD